jgi:antitoxin component YwqK of YwqJK toxin-antitoxin module
MAYEFNEKHQLLREAKYARGMIYGELKEYHPNGELKSAVNYKNGQPDGIYREYADDKTLRWEQTYVDGRREGISRDFYPVSGEVWFERIYQNDRLVKKTEFDRNGTVKAQYDFPYDDTAPRTEQTDQAKIKDENLNDSDLEELKAKTTIPHIVWPDEMIKEKE